jgi:hypothetical protein
MQGHHEGPSRKHAALWNALVAYLSRAAKRIDEEAMPGERTALPEEREVVAPRPGSQPHEAIRWGNFR